MTRMPRVVIIGGGIGGLTAALALDHRGAEVIVYEQEGRLPIRTLPIGVPAEVRTLASFPAPRLASAVPNV